MVQYLHTCTSDKLPINGWLITYLNSSPSPPTCIIFPFRPLTLNGSNTHIDHHLYCYLNCCHRAPRYHPQATSIAAILQLLPNCDHPLLTLPSTSSHFFVPLLPNHRLESRMMHPRVCTHLVRGGC